MYSRLASSANFSHYPFMYSRLASSANFSAVSGDINCPLHIAVIRASRDSSCTSLSASVGDSTDVALDDSTDVAVESVCDTESGAVIGLADAEGAIAWPVCTGAGWCTVVPVKCRPGGVNRL